MESCQSDHIEKAHNHYVVNEIYDNGTPECFLDAIDQVENGQGLFPVFVEDYIGTGASPHVTVVKNMEKGLDEDSKTVLTFVDTNAWVPKWHDDSLWGFNEETQAVFEQRGTETGSRTFEILDSYKNDCPYWRVSEASTEDIYSLAKDGFESQDKHGIHLGLDRNFFIANADKAFKALNSEILIEKLNEIDVSENPFEKHKLYRSIKDLIDSQQSEDMLYLPQQAVYELEGVDIDRQALPLYVSAQLGIAARNAFKYIENDLLGNLIQDRAKPRNTCEALARRYEQSYWELEEQLPKQLSFILFKPPTATDEVYLPKLKDALNTACESTNTIILDELEVVFDEDVIKTFYPEVETEDVPYADSLKQQMMHKTGCLFLLKNEGNAIEISHNIKGWTHSWPSGKGADSDPHGLRSYFYSLLEQTGNLDKLFKNDISEYVDNGVHSPTSASSFWRQYLEISSRL